MKKIISLSLLLFAALLLVACQPNNIVNDTAAIVVDATEVDLSVVPEEPLKVSHLEAWLSSGHADAEAEAFRHWDEEDPAVIDDVCGKCHSEYGYLDFIGGDGTAPGIDAESYPIGSTVTCAACHNYATARMDSVTMPSGMELTDLGAEARCMQCHQGRASKFSVDEAIGEIPDDEVNEDLSFINIHYFAAAAMKYGTFAQGGYEYEGNDYDGLFSHVEGYRTCIDCHDSHTLEIKTDECSECHDQLDTKAFRMLGSAVDYDGDGDTDEGIYYEIGTLKEALYAAIQSYASNTIGTGIIYDTHTYPYFFTDINRDGVVTDGEAVFDNQYAAWTPRLLRATYNYQLSMKDTGAYAHGGKYLIQLLIDSIADLGGDMTVFSRIDHGHFAGSEEAFRHWDEDDFIVPENCSRCHSAAGLRLYLETGETAEQASTNGFLCLTCHNTENFTRYEVISVTFPSGMTLSEAEHNDSFLCMTCHQGRSSGSAVDVATAEYGDHEVFEGNFINVHYFPAGATRYGAEAAGAYQYEGKEYDGYFEHMPEAMNECVDCHDPHSLEINNAICAECHDTSDITAIRIEDDKIDYDGDGDATEGMKDEIETLYGVLYETMQIYAVETTGFGIEYLGYYPYFTPEGGWTPLLLKAAYNYQYVTKDPGGYAHNARYIIQVLYDSIESLGGDVSEFSRPAIEVEEVD